MIAVDSSGAPISQAFIESVSKPFVSFDCVLLDSGAPLVCDILSLSLSLGSEADSSDTSAGLPLGGVWSSTMSASLANCAVSPLGRELEVRVGVECDGGYYEYVTVAWMTVTGAWTAAGVTTIEAVGRIAAKLSGQPIELTDGDYSPDAVAAAIAEASGVPVSIGSFQSSADVPVHVDQGATCRSVLGTLAGALGGYASEKHDGSILVAPFPRSSTFMVNPDIMPALPEVSDAAYTVDGLTVVVPAPDDGEDGESGQETEYRFGTGRIVVRDEHATAASAAALWSNIQGVSYRPGRVTVSVLDPRITPFDMGSVPLDGVSYGIPPFNLLATYDGGWFGSFSASGATDPGADASQAGPMELGVAEAREASRAAVASASRAWQAAEDATASAESAGEAAEQAARGAAGASAAAARAQSDAKTAKDAAQLATYSLSDVEKVVGTLNWIAEHGTYTLTQDTAIVAGKVYYTRSGTEPDYTYTIVAEPVAEQLHAYYELSLDESVQQYLAAHLWLDDYGLNLSVDSANGYRIHQGTVDGTKAVGTYILDPNGVPVASFGTDGARVGQDGGSHISLDEHGLRFWGESGEKRLEVGDIQLTNKRVNDKTELVPTVGSDGSKTFTLSLPQIRDDGRIAVKFTLARG